MSMQSIREVVRHFSVAMLVAAIAVLCVSTADAAGQGSHIVSREIHSEKFGQNKIGVSPIRKLMVYLPGGYDSSQTRYPVVYFLPSPFDSYDAVFSQHHAQGLLDDAIASGMIGRFILVTVDMTTPLGCSWYLNSPVTGNWEDFMVQELVPYMDANFRTLASRDSRGIAGDFMGGYGAIRFGMTHPEIFGSVYALHPVGTGSGVLPMYSRPDWNLLANAKTLEDVRKDGFSTIFTSIYEAHLPNPDKPPLYIDLQARKDGDTYVVDAAATSGCARASFWRR